MGDVTQGARSPFWTSESRGGRRRRHMLSPRSMSPELVQAVIDSCEDIGFKAITIVCAFAGLRLSEALHLWTCDVLDGSARPEITGGPVSQLPLVIVAHPRLSTYVGISASLDILTRADFLARTGRLCRAVLPANDPQRCGWKRRRFADEHRLISEALWSDERMAFEFSALVFGLEEARRHAGITDIPWLFVGTAPDKVGYLSPITRASYKDMLRRTLRAVGTPTLIAPAMRPNALRHFYKCMMDDIGLSVEDIRDAMGHADVTGGAAYGCDLPMPMARLAVVTASSNPGASGPLGQ